MYSFLIDECRMPNRIFQRLHRKLREKCSFHVTRHDAGRRRVERSPSLEKSFLNAVADRLESNTRAVTHHISVNHHTVFVDL
ncbi:hypothetical protein TNCV_1798461 [Trichonephila clavipes]|uniref:Uncharacterized protein n=1 Tax=Trichonephila clavipes TaxID=2585209 RepID=A0A8X6VH16_TRICX|nr:hypothetical protein TNCV_1798461 [Trichonephila clavipes]